MGDTTSNDKEVISTLRTVALINSNNDGSYALNGKIMLCTVVILFFAVFVILGFHTFAGYFFHSRRRRRRPRTHLHDPVIGTDGGLDVSTLKAIPTFTYAADHHPNITDCAVCLSDFEHGESGRVIPGCGHGFHAECIDMWFGSHSTCPLCRAPVKVMGGDDVAEELVEVTVEQPPSMEERMAGESGSVGCNRVKSPCNRVLTLKRICSI